jgi:hypothetical protein
MTWICIGLVLLTLFYAWRQSKALVDPDIAMFLLPGFVGSHYGRDFADCKTPAIHYTYWLLTKIVGKSIPRVKFAYSLLISSFGLAYFAITKDFIGAGIFIVLLNSGWLLSFHGNVSAVPAGFILMALAFHDPILSAGFMLLAVLYDPKIILTTLALTMWFGLAYLGWFGVGVVFCVICLVITRLLSKQLFDWLIESSVILPMGIYKGRTSDWYKVWLPPFTATGYLYILPWILAGVLFNPNLTFWLPAAVYATSMATGRVVRPFHLLPLAAWLAMSGITPLVVLALVITDWISSGFHFGDYFCRYYQGLYPRLVDSVDLGRVLAEKDGTLWVNCIDTELYIYADKPVPYGMCEQAEICSIVGETRRNEMKRRWLEKSPDWVVLGSDPTAVRFDPQGYHVFGKSKSEYYLVYRKNDISLL